jgi:hypothetical protein
MFEKVTSTSDHIFGASDASFKQQSSSHTWIISPGDTIDIENPLLHIAGSGPVDGLPQKLSSGRGELARLTSITIIANLFNHYHSSRLPVKVICDNQSMVKNSIPYPYIASGNIATGILIFSSCNKRLQKQSQFPSRG